MQVIHRSRNAPRAAHRPSSLPFPSSPPIVQARDNHRPVLPHAPIRRLPLHHKVRCEAQLPPSVPHVRPAVRPLHDLRVIRHDGDVIPLAHETLVLARAAVGFVGEDLHHVLLGVRGLVGGAVAVGGDVELLVVVEELEHVARRGAVDDGGRNELVHGLVVRGAGRVVDETGAAAVDGAGEKGHADGALVGYPLECADEVSTLEVLRKRVSMWNSERDVAFTLDS